MTERCSILTISWPDEDEGPWIRDMSRALARAISKRIPGTSVNVKTFGTVSTADDGRLRFDWKYFCRDGQVVRGWMMGGEHTVKFRYARGQRDYYCAECGEIIKRGESHHVNTDGCYRLHTGCGAVMRSCP